MITTLHSPSKLGADFAGAAAAKAATSASAAAPAIKYVKFFSSVMSLVLCHAGLTAGDHLRVPIRIWGLINPPRPSLCRNVAEIGSISVAEFFIGRMVDAG